MELHRQHDPLVRALGLTWGREGWGPSVVATGTVHGRAVEVRWRRAIWGSTTRARIDGAWKLLPEDADLREVLGG